jgi:hypothetical protein
MTKWKLIPIAAALISCVSMSALVSAAASESAAETPGAPAGVHDVSVLIVHGKITSVDKAKKEVTIEVNGKQVTLNVENPYNLKAVKAGDPIVVHYYEVVSIRKKKPGEVVPAASLSEGLATAHSGTPGAALTEQSSLLVTLVEVDPANGTVTVKGPDGSVEKVKARDPKNLKLIQAGDELVVSVSHVTAISIEKEAAN